MAQETEGGKMKKMEQLTIETERPSAARTQQPRPCVWCAACSQQVLMVTAFAAAVEREVNLYTIHRWAEAGVIHFLVTAEGELIVCLNSLTRNQQGGPKEFDLPATINSFFNVPAHASPSGEHRFR
jgi:hypothetical protein